MIAVIPMNTPTQGDRSYLLHDGRVALHHGRAADAGVQLEDVEEAA